MNDSSNNSDNHQTEQCIELAIVHGQESGVVRSTEKQLVLNEDMSYEQWCELVRLIQRTRKKASIMMADCILFGIKKFGRQKVDDALEQFSLEAAFVKAAVSIASIPVQMRFDNLLGDHYVELNKADLTKEQKIYWARVASEQGLTPSQLRFSIIEGEVVDRAASKMLQTGVITIQGIRQSFDIWHRRVKGIEGVKTWDLEDQIEIMEELDAICEFGMLLHEHLVQTQQKVEA